MWYTVTPDSWGLTEVPENKSQPKFRAYTRTEYSIPQTLHFNDFILYDSRLSCNILTFITFQMVKADNFWMWPANEKTSCDPVSRLITWSADVVAVGLAQKLVVSCFCTWSVDWAIESSYCARDQLTEQVISWMSTWSADFKHVTVWRQAPSWKICRHSRCLIRRILTRWVRLLNLNKK